MDILDWPTVCVNRGNKLIRRCSSSELVKWFNHQFLFTKELRFLTPEFFLASCVFIWPCILFCMH